MPRSPACADALDVSGGRFALKVDREGADLTGEAAVNQIPLAIEWRENFADDAPFERRFHLQGTLDASAPQRLGLALPLPAQGSFGLDATLLESAGLSEVEVALDLTPLAIEVAALGWRKPADEAGRLTATLFVPDDGPIQVEAFELSSAELEAAGSLELSLQPVQIERLVVSRLRAAGSAASLDLRQQTGGGYEVSVRAETLDLDRVLEARAATADDAPADPARSHGGRRPGAARRPARAERRRRPSGARRPGMAHRRSARSLAQGRQALVDAGRRGRASDASTSPATTPATCSRPWIRRPASRAASSSSRPGWRAQVPALEAEGTFRIDQFTLLDAPLLARLLTVASLTGIGNLLGRRGDPFRSPRAAVHAAMTRCWRSTRGGCPARRSV